MTNSLAHSRPAASSAAAQHIRAFIDSSRVCVHARRWARSGGRTRSRAIEAHARERGRACGFYYCIFTLSRLFASTHAVLPRPPPEHLRATALLSCLLRHSTFSHFRCLSRGFIADGRPIISPFPARAPRQLSQSNAAFYHRVDVKTFQSLRCSLSA